MSFPEIHSFTSRYLLIGKSYRTLKRWKTRRGPLFDRQVLNWDDRLIRNWKCFSPDVIVPIPRSYSRSWKMRGNSTELIGQRVARELAVPSIPCLNIKPSVKKQKRQAERNIRERLEGGMRLEIARDLPRNTNRILLIDDFMTTGSTVRTAAAFLKKQLSVREIHVFTLGVRVSRVK